MASWNASIEDQDALKESPASEDRKLNAAPVQTWLAEDGDLARMLESIMKKAQEEIDAEDDQPVASVA